MHSRVEGKDIKLEEDGNTKGTELKRDDGSREQRAFNFELERLFLHRE